MFRDCAKLEDMSTMQPATWKPHNRATSKHVCDRGTLARWLPQASARKGPRRSRPARSMKLVASCRRCFPRALAQSCNADARDVANPTRNAWPTAAVAPMRAANGSSGCSAVARLSCWLLLPIDATSCSNGGARDWINADNNTRCLI